MKSLSIFQQSLVALSITAVIFTSLLIANAQEATTTTPPDAPIATPAVPAAMTFRLEGGDPFVVRSRVDGIVERILVQPGVPIVVEAPIVEINSQRLELQREPLKTAFLQSYATYRQATKGDNPLAIAQAEAQAQSDATSYDVLLFDIQQHTSRTPIKGELSAVFVKPGQFVRQGEAVAEVLDSSRFTVDVPLSKTKARLGDKVALILEGHLIDGVIEEINPLSILQNSASRLNEPLITATLALKNNGTMQPGQAVIPVQDSYAIVPTKSLTVTADGNTSLRVMRGNDVVEVPAVALPSLKEGEQVVMADLMAGDLAVVPGPVANIPLTEPLMDLGAADRPQFESTESLAAANPQLLEQFPIAAPAETSSVQESPAAISFSELAVPNGVAGVLAADQLPLPDLNLKTLTSQLKLAPSDLLALDQLQSEFQTMLDEKGLHIKELADLKDIEGIAEYEKFLVAIRALNQDYVQNMLKELPEETASELETSLLENFGLNSLPKDVLNEKFGVDDQKVSELQKEFETEQFDVIKKLLNSEATLDQARETIKGLLDKKDQSSMDAVSAQAKDALALTMKQRQARFENLLAKQQTSINPPKEAIPNQPQDPPKKASVPKFAPPPVQNETDYVMLGMFGLIGVIVVGALGYFLGLFKLIKSLMTRSPDAGKKKRKDKLKNINRVEVGPEKAFQTIRDALAAVLENPFVKDEVAWDRHEIVLDPGVYQEVIHLDETYPAGIRILSEKAGQVTIVGDGTNPVIDASAVTDFGIEGLVIDGDAAATVIQLRDLQTLASLSQVIITGFKQFGLRVTNRNSEGELKVTLSETLFLSSMLETTGIFVDYGNLESSTLEIEKSRFHGPMQMGIQFRGPLHKTSIRESIFAYLGAAVLMAGTGHPFQQIKFSNNTFYRCGKGLFFRRVDLLTKGEREVLFDNNLFSQSEQGDIIVSDVVDAETVEATSTFIHDHSNGNLTDRNEESDFNAGLISLNGKAARVFPDFKFRSVEIDEPDFLMPTPDSPQRQAWAKKGLHGYVGALGPKSVVRSVMEPQS